VKPVSVSGLDVLGHGSLPIGPKFLDRTPLDIDAVHLAGISQGLAAELSRIVQVDRRHHTKAGPLRFDSMIVEPTLFRQNGMGKALAGRKITRRIHRNVISRYHPLKMSIVIVIHGRPIGSRVASSTRSMGSLV
jgi:hypothetical protein